MLMVPEIFGLIAASFVFFQTFINVNKTRISIPEMLAIIAAGTGVWHVTAHFFNLHADISSIIVIMFLIIILTFISYRKDKILSLSLLYAVFASAIFLFSGNAAGLAMGLIFNPAGPVREFYVGRGVLQLIYAAIALLLSFLISRYFGNFFHARMSRFSDPHKKKAANYILTGAVVTLLFYFTNAFLHNIITDRTILNVLYGVSFAAFFVFLLFAVFSFTDSLHKELEIAHKNEMLDNLNTYTVTVESMATEMRKFKHDHINLMRGFKAHLNNGNINKATEYYEKYMAEFEESAAVSDSHIEKLDKIQIPEIKSILAAKFTQAHYLNIDIKIEVSDVIANSETYNILDISRIMGIILDNAIEACGGLDNAIIKFAAFIQEAEVVFVLSNTYNIKPNIHDVGKKGYTTKGDGRGIGLYTASGLIGRNDTMAMKTGIEDGFFTQQVYIMP